MNTNLTTTILATSGKIGTSVVPACAHCGGFTWRLNGTQRRCEVCHRTSTLTITTDQWRMVK